MTLGMTAGVYAQTPVQPVHVSGHIRNPSTASATRPTVCFSLTAFKPNVPRVIANAILVNATNFCVTPAADGSFVTTLYGNDVITPAGTLWRVDFNRNSAQESSATYSIVGTSFNLDTAIPVITPPSSTTLIYGPKSDIFYQQTPALVWTIPHNFGDQNAVVQCRDLTDYLIFPDSIHLTDNNTTTVTFSTPQAGRCIALTAGNAVFTTAIGDALIKNPNTAQTVNTQNLILTGPLFEKILNTSTVFADQFTGVDASDKLQKAIQALPAAGGVVDARNLTDTSGNGSTIIDPGAHAVTILLGPYTYTISQIVLRSSLHIVGAGDGATITGGPMTILQSCGTCGSTPAVILGTGTAPYPVQSVILEGFRLYATAGNSSQIGMNLVAGADGGGLWYSTFRNICVGACGPGVLAFQGGNIVFDGTAGGSPNGVHQFNDLISVKSFRSAGGANAFKASGQNAQFTFKNCEFDGPGQSDASAANIWLGDGVAGLSTPLTTFSFDELTCQTSAVCASLNGAWAITFHQTHVEQVSGVFQLTVGATNGNIAIGVDHSYFAVNTGVNASAGYLVNAVSGTNAVTFSDNYMISTPDAICTGGCTGFNGINNFGYGGNTSNNNAAANKIASSLQVGNIQSNLAGSLAAGDIALTGWGSGASITSLQTPWSTGQSAFWTINVGTGPSANPTLVVTFPFGFNTPVLCTLDYHGGTHGFATLGQIAPIHAGDASFVFNGTPTASTGLVVFLRCGP